MDRQQTRTSLQFDDQALGDQEVQPRLTDCDALVRHGDGHLPGEANGSEPKLDAQRLLVLGLQKTGAEDTMDLQRGVDYDGSNLVELVIGFRQFGVFGVLAVHNFGIGLGCRPAMGVVPTRATPRFARASSAASACTPPRLASTCFHGKSDG